MWTLVLIVLTNDAGPSSGSAAAVSSMIFASQSQCVTAGAGPIEPDKGGAYPIIAKCVARNMNGGLVAGAGP